MAVTLRIEHNSAYSVRHTCASHLIAAGVPINIVAKQLGHSSVVVTERNYQGSIPELDEKQHDLIDALIDAKEAEKAKKNDGSL